MNAVINRDGLFFISISSNFCVIYCDSAGSERPVESLLQLKESSFLLKVIT